MNRIVHLTAEHRELLDILGVNSPSTLARYNAEQLLDDLRLANTHFERNLPLPDERLVEEWIAQAQTIVREETAVPQEQETGAVKETDNLPNRLGGKALPVLTHHKRTPAASHRKAKEETADRSVSERYMHPRGIRHTTPVRTWLGAVIAILFWLCGLSLIFLLPYILLFNHMLMRWHIMAFAFIGLILFLYLIVSFRCRCSVCKIRIFSWQRYVRNRKMHTIWGLGRVVPTALHVLLFKWFRCPSCGTAQRLRNPHSSR